VDLINSSIHEINQKSQQIYMVSEDISIRSKKAY